MRERNISTYRLIRDYDISSRTINNLKHNASITMITLGHLCEILDCTPNEIVEIQIEKNNLSQVQNNSKL